MTQFQLDIQTYAPLLLVLLIVLIQMKIFVSPTDLEKKHREILNETDEKYVTKSENKHLKDDMHELKELMYKIYDKLMGD